MKYDREHRDLEIDYWQAPYNVEYSPQTGEVRLTKRIRYTAWRTSRITHLRRCDMTVEVVAHAKWLTCMAPGEVARLGAKWIKEVTR